MNITLEDVEIAIKILNEFMKKQREAERVLRRLGISQRGRGLGGLSFESIYQMALQQAMAKKSLATLPESEEVEEELTEEELERIRAIKDKLKKQT